MDNKPAKATKTSIEVLNGHMVDILEYPGGFSLVGIGKYHRDWTIEEFYTDRARVTNKHDIINSYIGERLAGRWYFEIMDKHYSSRRIPICFAGLMWWNIWGGMADFDIQQSINEDSKFEGSPQRVYCTPYHSEVKL